MFDELMYIKFKNKYFTYFINLFCCFGILLVGFVFGYFLFLSAISFDFFCLIGGLFTSLSILSFLYVFLYLLFIYDKFICHTDLSSCSPDLQSLDNKER